MSLTVPSSLLSTDDKLTFSHASSLTGVLILTTSSNFPEEVQQEEEQKQEEQEEEGQKQEEKNEMRSREEGVLDSVWTIV